MTNRKSDYLVILIATYNRLGLLKKTLDSIVTNTSCSHEIIVIDGGSTDGTIKFLKSHPNITPVFQDKLLGTARAYNQVWKQIESKFTSWLSDDTEVVNQSLDMAVSTIESHPQIGMVGLKMKDTMGDRAHRAYLGGISEFGILNCNHGVLPTDLLRSVGYFNESYRSYTIDPDLTASILCTGKRVVMTKAIGVLHHRGWANTYHTKEREKEEMGGIDNLKIYRQKFNFLKQQSTNHREVKVRFSRYLKKILYSKLRKYSVRIGGNDIDRYNIRNGQFIRILDPLYNIWNPYHLVQRIPRNLLKLKTNPYRHLLDQSPIK